MEGTMKKGLVELYGDDDLARLRQQIQRARVIYGAMAVAGLAACLTMIALTGTGNAARMELAVIAVSTVVGWLVIYGLLFVIGTRRKELRHASMLREGERQEARGAVTVTEERVTIRKSVTVRKVEVRGDQGTRQLRVCESRAEALMSADIVAVYAVHGYVAAYEVAS